MAQRKIALASGKCMSLKELMESEIPVSAIKIIK